MGVDAERRVQQLPEAVDSLGDDVGQLAAVGVAQHDAVGAGVHRRVERGQRVPGVEPPAVEEMLGVVHHLAAELLEPGDAVVDHAEVLGPGGLEHPLHVQRRGLPHQGDDRGLRVRQRLDVGIVLAEQARPAGAAERRHPGPLQREIPQPPEELGVLGIGAGPSAFDAGHAEPVQRAGDLHLVVHRQGEALALGAVAERGVVELERGGRAHELPQK